MEDNRITLFATPRPFRDAFTVIQRNAIASWVALGRDVEIILMGTDEGTAEVAAEFGVRHIPEVPSNEHGTPLVSGLFQTAERFGSGDILAYINADIVLLPDFLEAVRRIRRDRFLMVGRSWGLTLNEPLDLSSTTWQAELTTAVRRQGVMRDGMDYFVFSRGLWPQIPPLAVGRGAWDHWLIYGALQTKSSAIDITEVTTVIHQDHGWSTVPGGAEWIWNGPEIQRNRELVGHYADGFSVRDATWRLTQRGLRPVLGRQRLGRFAERIEMEYRALRVPARLLHLAAHPRRLLRRGTRGFSAGAPR